MIKVFLYTALSIAITLAIFFSIFCCSYIFVKFIIYISKKITMRFKYMYKKFIDSKLDKFRGKTNERGNTEF